MEKQFRYGTFLYGVVYYPEQWPEAKWDVDLSRIAATGMNVVRMGEGAWSFWEPEEHVYDFSLFDRALELCNKHGLKAIMGTPTYTPPAWLTEGYPEVLRVSFDGKRLTHGSRRHYNYTSPIYWKKSEEIIRALARHYREHPAVIGWQIDNELNCHVDDSFAPSDHLAFRSWCKERYGTLLRLNGAWGTAFWSQTYTDWKQIWLPRPTATYQNPALLLDFYRFTSDITIRFAAMQYQLLKSVAPDQFVTHNAFQSMTNVDLYEFTQETVDFLSYDSYPEFKICNPRLLSDFRERSEGRLLSKIRGVSRKFMVLEQQSGPSGQIGGILNGNPDYLHPTPKPGQMRLWCWNSIAHGADGLLFSVGGLSPTVLSRTGMAFSSMMKGLPGVCRKQSGWGKRSPGALRCCSGQIASPKRRSSTISRMNRIAGSSTSPGNTGIPANSQSTRRSRKGIC